jgi:hypothetical protein
MLVETSQPHYPVHCAAQPPDPFILGGNPRTQGRVLLAKQLVLSSQTLAGRSEFFGLLPPAEITAFQSAAKAVFVI